MLFKVYSRYVPNLTRQDGSAFDRLLQSNLWNGRIVQFLRHGASAIDPLPPSADFQSGRRFHAESGRNEAGYAGLVGPTIRAAGSGDEHDLADGARLLQIALRVGDSGERIAGDLRSQNAICQRVEHALSHLLQTPALRCEVEDDRA